MTSDFGVAWFPISSETISDRSERQPSCQQHAYLFENLGRIVHLHLERRGIGKDEVVRAHPRVDRVDGRDACLRGRDVAAHYDRVIGCFEVSETAGTQRGGGRYARCAIMIAAQVIRSIVLLPAI